MNERSSLTSHRPTSPLHDLFSAKREWDNLLADARWPFLELNEKLTAGFSPLCEADETDKEYLFRFEIPGMRKEDISIEVENGVMTVSGERKQQKDEKKGKRHFSEINYGSFYRTFTLPSAVDETNIDAQYKGGVLKVTAKKLENSKAKRIAIH